ncbi:MAG: hypothetical protein HY657_15165 [Acidobacteria bacterium]|nr:hypothetical protein [Acidobacteriota bacterium]
MRFLPYARAVAETSPLPATVFQQPHADLTGHLYESLLDLLPRLLDHPNEYRELWEDEDRALGASEDAIEEETGGARWVFDGVDRITPALHVDRTAASSLAADAIVAHIERRLRTSPPAWDPYD